MEVFRDYVTKQLPAYLKGLPIPASIDGFATLSQDELVAIAPLFLLIASMFVMIVLHLFPEKASRINKSIRLGEAKVVDSVTRKEIAAEEKETIAYCRCWQSKKFPYCDGSHNAYNTQTGDNLGPLVIKK